LFPGNQEKVQIEAYGDQSDKGNSVADLKITEQGKKVQFSFQLKDGYQYPYAGMSIKFLKIAEDTTFLDLSGYEFLKLHLQSGSARSLKVYLKTYLENFTSLNDFITYQFSMKEISIDSNSGEYLIRLIDMKTPEWWYEEHKILKENVGKPDFSRTISLEIENGTTASVDSLISCTINKLTFEKNGKRYIYGTLIFIVLYYLILLLVKIKIGSGKREKVVVPYEKIELKNPDTEELGRIKNYIAQHFAEPELTVETVAKGAGITAAKIPTLLKEHINMNFKQYLNTIRMHEAKRLIKMSDRSIVEIAYAVGYNSISHFNRTFKQMENVSPTEYRKKN
jgi:AraC-like DNA-binding protein